jgi:hypothetical protein
MVQAFIVRISIYTRRNQTVIFLMYLFVRPILAGCRAHGFRGDLFHSCLNAAQACRGCSETSEYG